jgi:argonaute-like protein implicated in RNA metabolism and viral defense
VQAILNRHGRWLDQPAPATYYHLPQGQGKDHVILFPSAPEKANSNMPIACRERLGELLNDYHRKAA